MASAARSTARSTRRRVLRDGLLLLAGLGLLVGIYIFLVHLRQDPLADVRAYYDAGARLNAGLPLYDQPSTTNEAEFYRYPPLLAIAFRPLALLPYEVAAVLWEIIVVVSFALTVWRLGFRVRTAIAVGLLAFPIGWALAIGQAHVPMTLLMTIGSPWAIAFAAHLKVLPALAAIWWIGRREWRSLGHFGAWVLGLGLLQLVLEPSATLAFPGVFGLAQVGDVRNWSPYAVSPALWAVLVVAGIVLALRLAPTRYGWAAAVALSVLATPRLLVYQLMALLAATREPWSESR
jgi:hypothetical protein